jgi:hypothetical protein
MIATPHLPLLWIDKSRRRIPVFTKTVFRRCVIAVLIVLSARTALVSASSQDDIRAAIQKVADASNYSWTVVSVDRFRSVDSDGKVQKDGLTYLHFDEGDGGIYAYIKGDRIAVKLPQGEWQTIDEAVKAEGANGQPSEMRSIADGLRSLPTPIAMAQKRYKDLTNIQKTDDGYSADLTPEEVREFFPASTTNPSDPHPWRIEVNAKISVAFSIQDGMVTKMKMQQTGSYTVDGGDKRDVDSTTTVTFTNVGTTTIDVPAEAQAKLAS